MEPSLPVGINATSVGFQIHNLPNGLQHTVARDLPTIDVLSLSKVCRGTHQKYFPIFEQRVGRTDEGVAVLETLMRRCRVVDQVPGLRQLGDEVWELPKNRKVVILSTLVADNWYTDLARLPLHNVFDANGNYTQGQIDCCRLLVHIPMKRRPQYLEGDNFVITDASVVNRMRHTDVICYLIAFESCDIASMERAYKDIPSRADSVGIPRPGRPDATYTRIDFLIGQACRALFALDLVHTQQPEHSKREAAAKVQRSKVLWKCIIEDCKTLPQYSNIPKLSPALEEYHQFFEQVGRSDCKKRAYSCVSNQVVDAPQGLYDLLEELADPSRFSLTSYQAVWSRLFNGYVPTYAATVSCLLCHLIARHSPQTEREFFTQYFTLLRERSPQNYEIFHQTFERLIRIYLDKKFQQLLYMWLSDKLW